MADIHQTISLGIGSPSGVPEFLTFGLQIGAVVVTPGAPDERTFSIFAENRAFEIWRESRTFEIPEDSKTFEVEE